MGTIGKSSKNQILDSGIQNFCTGFFSSLRIWYSGNAGSSIQNLEKVLDSRIQTILEMLDPESRQVWKYWIQNFFSSFYLDPESRIWKRYWIPDSSKKNQFQFYLDPDYGQILDLIWPDKSRFFFQQITSLDLKFSRLQRNDSYFWFGSKLK